jgi:hypothetical protein
MPSTRTPNLRVAGAVVVGNGTWPTRYVRSVAKARRIIQNITARSTAAGAPFTPTLAPVLTDGTTIGASAAAAKTYLQGRPIKNLKGNRVSSLVGKLLRT